MCRRALQRASDCQGRRAVHVTRVETAFAVGTEQVRHAHAGLSQHQFEVGLLAFGTDFAHAAEGQQIQRRAVIAAGIDNGKGIEFAKDEVTNFVATSCVWRIDCVIRYT